MLGTRGGRGADRRARITDAAIEVFADRGFHGARVADVARRAGVADGTIYLYFRNKEELLLSVFEEKMQLLLDGVRGELDGVVDPEERIRRFATWHFRQVHENRAAARVLQIELRLSGRFLKEYRPETLWAYLNVFGSTVRDGIAAGRFRPDVDPFVGMWAFFGALDEIAMQWVLSRRPDRFTLDDAARQVAEVFIRGLRVDRPAAA
jgi:TetR/AcrR family fatty acid metabolism transcriptional regulator